MIKEAWHKEGYYIERCTKCKIPTCFLANQKNCGNYPCYTEVIYKSYRKIKREQFLENLKKFFKRIIS